MNKIIITIFTFLMTQCVIAKDFNFGYNIVTMHTFDRSVKFENKFDKNGIFMHNPIFKIGYKTDSFFIGKDSIDSTMIGYYKNVDNFIFGAYSHNFLDWKNKKIEHTFALPIFKKYGIIPIIGCKQNLFSKDNVKIDAIITPLTINLFSSFYF